MVHREKAGGERRENKGYSGGVSTFILTKLPGSQKPAGCECLSM